MSWTDVDSDKSFAFGCGTGTTGTGTGAGTGTGGTGTGAGTGTGRLASLNNTPAGYTHRILTAELGLSTFFSSARRLVVRNAFSRNGFVFDRNFFEILKIFRSQTPEDLVLEWFRRYNGRNSQIKSASIDTKSSTKAHLGSRQRFLGVWGAQNGAGLRDLGVQPILGSPQVGLCARFRSRASVFDRNFSQRKSPRGVCF